LPANGVQLGFNSWPYYSITSSNQNRHSLTYPTARFWLPTFITCSISLTLFVTNDWRS